MKIQRIENELHAILDHIAAQEMHILRRIKHVHPEYRLSAMNLCHYLLLRSFDLRKYHATLSDLGVSSIRSSEGYVLSNLYHVVKNLRLLQGESLMVDNRSKEIEKLGYKRSHKLMRKHANALFNATQKRHSTEIMVTIPLEAADDPSIIKKMVEKGMEIARINLSHGDISQWTKMVDQIKAIKASGRSQLKIYMDLSGPKIRTADIAIHGKKKTKDSIAIREGEHILLTSKYTDGKKSEFGDDGEQLSKAEIGVSLHQIIGDAQVGDIILFDDGMIRSKVIDKAEDALEIVITHCYKSKLSSRKGINLPSTKLNLPALTDQDLENLPFVCEHADILGYSFVRSGEDVQRLYKALDQYAPCDIGVVFKIENKEAFENLPDILLAGMSRPKIGVMIARGDLAVEMGFERISEVQKQILWLCEASHIPVIWATQVLDNLAKNGIPTRAEMSDAALGAQAECVMLNKGPYIYDAIEVLRDVLVRIEGHYVKKKNQMRPLNVAINYVQKNLAAVIAGH